MQQKILTPLNTRGFTLKNRLVLPPAATAKSNADGSVSDALVAHYADKARSGLLGMVFSEHASVNADGRADPHQLSAGPGSEAGLSKIAAVIHKSGAKAAAQISHAGSAAISEQPYAPSAVPNPRVPAKYPVREMTLAEIEQLINDFAAAAKRVNAAGFDAVEIHSAHAYMLNQFFSPLTNHRTDAYGGDLAGRIRIHLEIISAVRDAVGSDYPVLLRLGATDRNDGGVTDDDVRGAAQAFAEAGICILDVTGGHCGYRAPEGDDRPGYFAPQSKIVRAASGIPVILTGGIKSGEAAEEFLQNDTADLIGVCRAILQDPDWPTKELV